MWWDIRSALTPQTRHGLLFNYTLHVKGMLASHCSAPRYQNGTMVNPGRMRRNQTGSVEAHTFVTVGTNLCALRSNTPHCTSLEHHWATPATVPSLCDCSRGLRAHVAFKHLLLFVCLHDPMHRFSSTFQTSEPDERHFIPCLNVSVILSGTSGNTVVCGIQMNVCSMIKLCTVAV